MKAPLRYAAGFATLVLFLVGGPAFALDPYSDMLSQMSTSSQSVADKLAPAAFRLLGTLFLIQFAIRNYKMALSGQGDILQVLAKLVLPILWIGFLMMLINNSFTYLNMIFSGFQKLAGIASGGIDMSPGKIMGVGVTLTTNLQVAYDAATGASGGFLTAMKLFFPSLLMCFACLAIIVSFFIIGLAVAIATLEFYMIVAAAPIVYALGGLDALKQSSIAPLQTMISIGFRILILGVIVGVMRGQVDSWSTSFGAVTATNWAPVWTVVFGCMLGAVAAFSAGKIAGALASGQSNISGNEGLFAAMQMMQTIATSVTAAAAAGQMLGGAAGTASKGAAGAGGLASQGFAKLSDVFGGGSGSISSAGSGGGGGGGKGGGGSGGMSSADAAESVLGPLGGSPVDSAGAGDAFDAAIGSPSSGADAGSSGRSAGGSEANAASGQAAGGGGGAGSPPTAREDQMAKAMDNMAEAMKGQRPSAGTQMGRAAMAAVQGTQHDSGHVHVHVDTNSKD